MARLASGIRRRPNGTLEKRITIDGKRYSIYGATAKEIDGKEQEIRERIKAGGYTKNGDITLDKYFAEWLEAKRIDTKGNTLKTYTSNYKKHIGPRIGNRKIKDIERREVQELQREISKELAPATTNLALKTLRAILSDAVKDDIITKNPAGGIKALKTETKATETYHRALTEQEQADFMQEIKQDYYYSFVALMITTGLRIGEVSALTWQDIDYKAGVIHINKTMSFNEAGGRIVGTPKTEASNRDIPLNDTIRRVIADYRKTYGDILPFTTSRVFSTPRGRAVENITIIRAINNALKRLESKGVHIDRFTPHAFRDTFATRYIEQGGTPQTLKTILGHNSLAITMDLYAHVLPNTKAEEMAKIIINI